MPFSHHSHSGQFCPGHARNTLEEMVGMAVAKHMSVFALTEHMPRHEADFYPEEIEAGYTFAWHVENERKYFTEAVRLREKYKKVIAVPIGFESEWVGRSGAAGGGGSGELIERSLGLFGWDFLVGSVHHVHRVPIDYTAEDYARAREVSGGSDERLFEDYFDAQFEMLKAVKPPVVGHFDLIRLMSGEPNGRLGRWEGVWARVVRNLDFISGYGGLVELNFAALRKGMKEPYPTGEVCKAFVEKGGRFCVSDDSHGIEQVAFGYDRLLPFLDEVGIGTVHFLVHAEERQDRPHDERFPHLVFQAIQLEKLKDHPFWTAGNNSREDWFYMYA